MVDKTIKGGNCDILIDYEKCEAIKKLRNKSSKEKIQRFINELDIMKVLSTLDFPNVVKINEVHIDDKIENCYINMKKYDGNLYDLLSLTKGNVKFTLKLLLPIIETLKKLSELEKPIYHRDIKPDNILYKNDHGEYKLFLTDFGIAYYNNENEKRLTEATIAMGPRNFIAPEYEKGRVDKVDEKGDIFSIGKIIWFLINGEGISYLPSNFWFVDEYNLTNKFPNNNDIVLANMIIASCLEIEPLKRNNYDDLIANINNILSDITIANPDVYKVIIYEEKRKIERKEICEKNINLVTVFNALFIASLKDALFTYKNIELLKHYYDIYFDRMNRNQFINENIINNRTHYLFSDEFDKIYLAINYVPPDDKNSKYSHLVIEYHIKSMEIFKKFKVYYDNKNNIVCFYGGNEKILSKVILIQIINEMISDYIKE